MEGMLGGVLLSFVPGFIISPSFQARLIPEVIQAHRLCGFMFSMSKQLRKVPR